MILGTTTKDERRRHTETRSMSRRDSKSKEKIILLYPYDLIKIQTKVTTSRDSLEDLCKNTYISFKLFGKTSQWIEVF